MFSKKGYQKVAENKAIKNFSLQKSSNGLILKIGKRGSPNYYRVYENNTEIRFEFDQKRSENRGITKLILKDQIEEFEQVIIERFFKYTKKDSHQGWFFD